MKPSGSKTFHPAPHPGVWITLALALLAGGLAAWLFSQLPGQAFGSIQFWLFIGAMAATLVALWLLYRAVALWRLTYTISRNGLEIRWGALTLRLPSDAIEDLVAPTETTRRLYGLSLPAWWVLNLPNHRWLSTSNTPLIVHSEVGDLAISPVDPDDFLAEWQRRRDLGPSQPWVLQTIRRGVWAHPLWRDRWAGRLGLGAVLIWIITTGAFFVAYDPLPVRVAISLGNLGQETAITAKTSLLLLPAIGTIVLIFNLFLGALLYRQQRMLTYILWLGALVVQLGLWVGSLMILA